MNHAPQIRKAEITGPFQVTIEWSTGETFVTDLSSTTGPKREGDPFAALHDPAILAQTQSDDWGDGLSWPGGLDLGADQLYNLGASRRACPRAIQRGMGGHAAKATVKIQVD